MLVESLYRPAYLITYFVLISVFAEVSIAQENPYTEIVGWIQSPDSRELGSVSWVDADPKGNIWIAERCGANSCIDRDDVSPIHMYSASGVRLAHFGDGMLVWPHGIHVDFDGNIWVTDGRGDGQRGYQAFKFNPAGEVLMTLGEAGVAGDGVGHFSSPTDVLVAPNGDIFVSDGHEPESNNRVLKFSADGKFIKSWGVSGSSAGEFSVPHALAMDSQGRLFVADRDNNRVQIFNQEGTYLAQWSQYGRATGIYISDDDTLYVSDNQSNLKNNPGWQRGIRVGDARDGLVKAFIPDPTLNPDMSQATGAHGLYANSFGEIYGAEVVAETVRKFVH
ncbi:MAG: peptidyl-alpha-hydroxyglycine alpha-amidating lyase family protein [Arenicellaceae bacterium]|nr:peptidyl-alpha-hydroxyglycine alpha-amidating lyase family protein [Arenicellaceae bacterium]